MNHEQGASEPTNPPFLYVQASEDRHRIGFCVRVCIYRCWLCRWAGQAAGVNSAHNAMQFESTTTYTDSTTTRHMIEKKSQLVVVTSGQRHGVVW